MSKERFIERQTDVRESASRLTEATPQVLSAAKNNMVALPGQLFHGTQIPVCLWFLAKYKSADAKRGFRDRRQHDARLEHEGVTFKQPPYAIRTR